MVSAYTLSPSSRSVGVGTLLLHLGQPTNSRRTTDEGLPPSGGVRPGTQPCGGRAVPLCFGSGWGVGSGGELGEAGDRPKDSTRHSKRTLTPLSSSPQRNFRTVPYPTCVRDEFSGPLNKVHSQRCGGSSLTPFKAPLQGNSARNSDKDDASAALRVSRRRSSEESR